MYIFLSEFGHFITQYFSVGNLIQNILFYSLILFLFAANLYLVRRKSIFSKQRTFARQNDLASEDSGLIQVNDEIALGENIRLRSELLVLKTDLLNLGRELELSYAKSDKLTDQLSDILDCLDLVIDYDERSWNWTIDLKSDELFLSDYGLHIIGLPQGTRLTWIEFLDVVDKQYQAEVKAALMLSFETGAEFYMIFKIKPFDGGKEKWIKSIGNIIYSDEGIPLMLAGRFTFTFGESAEVRCG
jgi:hypothetical protein